ncbi:hypothetical protein UP09_14285 [Bradyrhizobium sp. LTSP885]|uniref:hypothetical protein n=1 Tax=Bradyrhizobium sp. LTSP885 TaxID=1619232 RepID=UPI0005CAB254|nr:hypothetical protein [Bradyrhizobium sp. LTSP885]KJC44815.1 hypothetical protein UP09_14285 [Bradyrhizobium sp. LTSP885]
MALFSKSDPIAAAVVDRTKLAGLETDAKLALDIAEQAAEASAARGADDATVKADNARVQECRDLLARRQTAGERKDADIVTLTSERDKKLDQETRHNTAGECETRLRSGHAIGKRFDAVMAELAEYAAWAVPFIPEAGGLHNYCKASATQIPEALTLIGKLAANHAAAVLAGTAPATLRRPEPAPVPTVAPVAPTVHLFAMRSVKWKDANGSAIVAQACTDVYLTPNAAMRALSAKACVQINDPLRRKHHGTVAGHADPRFALDLDADPESTADPILASTPASPQPQFTVVDRGPAIQMKVVR